MVHFFTLILNLENADFIDPESNKREGENVHRDVCRVGLSCLPSWMFEILNISDTHILIGCILDDEPILFSLAKMLNSSSPAQKNLSEEDSSGSEPETDRFGFILTNGSTAG